MRQMRSKIHHKLFLPSVNENSFKIKVQLVVLLWVDSAFGIKQQF